MNLDDMKCAGKQLPRKFWTVEDGRVEERIAHGITEHGFKVTVERWAGLRTETIPFTNAYKTEAKARIRKTQ